MFLCLISSYAFSQNFAVGGYVKNSYSLGEYSNYSICDLGVAAYGNYLLPFNMPLDMKLGLSVLAEYAHVFPKTDSVISNLEDVSFAMGILYFLPFNIASQLFKAQIQVDYGVVLHCMNGIESVSLSSLYVDQLIDFALGLRWSIPKLENLDILLFPTFRICPETEGNLLLQAGFKVGAVYTFSAKSSSTVQTSESE